MNFLTAEEQRDMYKTVLQLDVNVRNLTTNGCLRGEDDRQRITALENRKSVYAPNGVRGGSKIIASLAGGGVAGAIMAAKAIIEHFSKPGPTP